MDEDESASIDESTTFSSPIVAPSQPRIDPPTMTHDRARMQGHAGNNPAQSYVPPSAASSSIDEPQDKDLLDLLSMLDDFTPIIPDSLTEFYMSKAGVECDDVRLKRLIAVVAQKFITDVAGDAMQYSRLRQGGNASGSKRGTGKKATLTLEDLSAALGDYGINIKRPNYHL